MPLWLRNTANKKMTSGVVENSGRKQITRGWVYDGDSAELFYSLGPASVAGLSIFSFRTNNLGQGIPVAARDVYGTNLDSNLFYYFVRWTPLTTNVTQYRIQAEYNLLGNNRTRDIVVPGASSSFLRLDGASSTYRNLRVRIRAEDTSKSPTAVSDWSPWITQITFIR